MNEICSKCGLPKEICVCKEIEKQQQRIRIFVEKRKWGKLMTIIEGVTEGQKELASELKTQLGCGGTFKENHIELQGDHRKKVRQILLKKGYSEEQIEVV